MKYAIIKHSGNPNSTLYCSQWLNAQGKVTRYPVGLDSQRAAQAIASRFGGRVVIFTDAEWAVELESRNRQPEY